MTSLIRRWTLLAAVAIASCEDAASQSAQAPFPEPSGPRVVFVVAPGLDAQTLDLAIEALSLPELSALKHRAELRPPKPVHPRAVMTSLLSGAAPPEHGVFDGTERRPNRYARSPAPRITAARVEQGRVSPPRFEGGPPVEPFWETLAAAGVPVSVLFAPDVLPLEGAKARVLAGGLPNLVGRPARATLLVRPGDAPVMPSVATAEAGPMPRRQRREEGRRRPRREGPVAEPLGDDPTPGPVEAPKRAGAEHGVLALEPVSNGVWTGVLSLEVDGREGELKRLGAQLVLREQGDSVVIQAGTREMELLEGERSPWVPLTFVSGGLEVSARSRFHLLSREPLRVLVADPTLDPDAPFFGVSHPPELLRSIAGHAGPGPFTASGTALDTGAATFVSREFRAARLRERCQWRADALIAELEASESRVLLLYLDVLDDARRLARDASLSGTTRAGLEALDHAVGRIRRRLREKDTLVIVSPLALPPASRAVHLNRWLEQKRYLRRGRGGEIDWSRSQAYAAGQGAIYLNVRGREPSGSLPAQRAGRLARKIARELQGLRDGRTRVAREVWLGDDELAGSQRSRVPDIVLGLAPGYVAPFTSTPVPTRALFESVSAAFTVPTTPADSPGVVLANRPLALDEVTPMDVAATAHAFVGVAPPATVVGEAWFAPPPGEGRE